VPLLRVDRQPAAGQDELRPHADRARPLLDGVLSGGGAPGSARQARPVPAVSRVLPSGARCSKQGDLLPFAPGSLVSGDRAVALCWGCLETREGGRVGLLGDPGCGKTTAAKRLARAYLERSRGLVVVADSKGEAGWPGEYRRDPKHLVDWPNVGRELVFSPDAFGEPLSLEAVARFQWALAARRCASLCVYDEIGDGADDGEWEEGATALPRVFTHGRRVGISAIWGAQFAQMVPRAAYECSSYLLVFRQAGNALGVLRRRGYTDEAVEAVIRALPGDDVPPKDRGHFVVLRRGRPWDGLVYRFGA
jgi:hypothetical protein